MEPWSPCAGPQGWARGASGGQWGPNHVFLDKVHETKIARHLRYNIVDRLRNFIQVSASQSMAPGKFCSRGPLANQSQTWYKCWLHETNTMAMPPYFYQFQHDLESARRPRRGRLAPHYSAWPCNFHLSQHDDEKVRGGPEGGALPLHKSFRGTAISTHPSMTTFEKYS